MSHQKTANKPDNLTEAIQPVTKLEDLPATEAQSDEVKGGANKLQELRARAVADIDKATGGAISAQAATAKE